MFGSRRKITELEATVALLQEKVTTLEQTLASFLDDEASADALRRAAEHAAAIATLREQLEAPRDQPPHRGEPQRMALSEVHCAPSTGYVSLWSGGGWTDRVELFVGFESPPQQLVGKLNTRNDINSYVGTVVRRGEFWRAASERTDKGKDTGVCCVFTPFA